MCTCLREVDADGRQAGPKLHACHQLAVDADIESELTAIADCEVGHHLRVAPNRLSRLQSERLVDGEMMNESPGRPQSAKPARIRPGRVDHHIRAVFVVLAQVAVYVAHEHQDHDRAPGQIAADLQAAVVDHPLGGVGIHENIAMC